MSMGPQTMPLAGRASLRPDGSSVLWGHLLPGSKNQLASSLIQATDTLSPSSLPPITPVDKAGTSLRILLHDTQANLEKFSERVDKLTGGVEEAKRDVALVHTLFQQDREKLVESVVDLVNRCQTEIQRSLGIPAQAPKAEELQLGLSSMEHKLEALDRKVDLMHMLNQTQLQALQALQEQQTKIVASLTPLLPLLQTMPSHIENAMNRVQSSIRNLEFFYSLHVPSSRSKVGQIDMGQAKNVLPRFTSASPTDAQDTTAGSKKRKLVADQVRDATDTPSFNNHSFTSDHASGSDTVVQSPQVFDNSSHISARTLVDLPAVLLTSRLNTHDGRTTEHNETPLRMPSVDLLHSGGVSRSSGALSSPRAETVQTIGHSIPQTLVMSSAAPVKSPSNKSRSRMAILHATSPRNRPPPRSTSPNHGMQKVNSLVSSTSTLSQRDSDQPACSNSPPRLLVSGTTPVPHDGNYLNNIMTSCSATSVDGSRPFCSVTPQRAQSLSRLWELNATERSPTMQTPYTYADGPGGGHPLQDAMITAQSFVRPSLVSPMDVNIAPDAGVGKPMSLRDRRAMYPVPSSRNEGKRFIPLDDEESEDYDLSVE